MVWMSHVQPPWLVCCIDVSFLTRAFSELPWWRNLGFCCLDWSLEHRSTRFIQVFVKHLISYEKLDKTPDKFVWNQKTTWTSHKVLIDWLFLAVFIIGTWNLSSMKISDPGDKFGFFLSVKTLKCGQKMIKKYFQESQ